MPGRPPLRLVLLPLLLVAGCATSSPEPRTGPLSVPVSSADARTAELCRALSRALPDEVDPGVERREVLSDATRTAAWGDPPVTLECGVPDPERREEPVFVNGVAWTVRDIGAGFRWTTKDRVVNVAVEIPSAYANGAEIVNPLSGPVAASIPAR